MPCAGWRRRREQTGGREGSAVNLYIPIVGMVVLATVFVAVSMTLSVLIGPGRKNRAKYDSYECGIQPTPQPVGGGRFPVKYYVIAMLFIVFDIEIVFLYPWAVTYHQLGLFGVIAIISFIVTVLVAYFYVKRRGGLDWD
ncbi:NADH-quinone oxidoreductase subunit A [Arachnia propionica]|uniref:NADH-quinone oxidoreductase subunit A n=1 Tax=Arachnia propionica TaxID=1750 RepID=A0AB37I4G4_9ACTN|nr:NADH-quinone oxidoreductase subunit A [Arachnia propionica]QCT38558.1 NADH-quinone oxidoreductase subunit A [Arachnia propionica]QUC11846.1 NADH-quinone oxidoreductase subunit A [Arachnia propionica]QUC13462.1 NADH-quinone oxidoreductase subunit A [Arachnia propionica]RPA18659.1 NADH-quinone oxidoreductase subunit A [Arachnia propionica]